MTIDLRLGDYRNVLADVTCGALITDPPFSARTHEGHGSTLYAARRCGRRAVGAEIDPGAHSAALGLDLGGSEGQLVML